MPITTKKMRWGGASRVKKIILGVVSTILASTLALQILATQASNAYADNTASTDTTLKISDDVQLSVTAPTVINYKLEPDGTFIYPTDATIKNNSSIPIATKSWSANILTGTAVSKDDFTVSSASNAWWNTISADDGELSPFNLNTETLYDSWNMATSGQSLNDTQDDTLSLVFDGGMKNIDGSIDYNTGKQLATVTLAFGTILNKQEPKPDPENGIMFAVYSSDDNSLNFYKRDRVPEVGDIFNRKSVTAVWSGIENAEYSYPYNQVPWTNEKKKDYSEFIKSVSFIDHGCKPRSLAYWFNGLSNMTRFDGKNLDTSSVTSMLATFHGCKKLSNLDSISDWETSANTSLYYTFEGCSGLASLTSISKWNTSSVESLYGTFSDCNGLMNLDSISEWDTSNVTRMSCLFYGCSGLVNLNSISCWDTSKVTDMGSMFYGCNNLTNLDSISNWNISSNESLSGTFSGCSSLIRLNLANWDTSSVTDMFETFKDCKELNDLDSISNWNTSNLYSYRSLEGTFSGCNKLKNLDLSNWSKATTNSLDSTFKDCSSLTKLNLTNWNTASVLSMNYTFSGCNSLTSLDLSYWDTSKVSSGYKCFSDCNNLAVISVGNLWKWQWDGWLPVPSNTYINDADGKWYAGSDGIGYVVSNIPSKKAETYYASKSLRDTMITT